MQINDKLKMNVEALATLPAQQEAECIAMDDSTFIKMRDFIYNYSGMYLKENRKYLLEKRLSRRLKKLQLSDFNQYYQFLLYNKEELNFLFDTITINETSFFRNQHQIEAFQAIVFPEMLEKAKRQKKSAIRILSTGCATGEEPYTLAMVLDKQFKSRLRNVRPEIIGTDISQQVLDTAEKGIYSEFSMRNILPEYLDLYFSRGDMDYRISEKIRKMVQFLNVNIMDTRQMNALGKFDVIFCSNVLMYFEKESKMKTVQLLYENLVPGGYLFIGQSESLHGISRAFKLVHFVKAIGYKKDE